MPKSGMLGRTTENETKNTVLKNTDQSHYCVDPVRYYVHRGGIICRAVCQVRFQFCGDSGRIPDEI